MGHHTRAAELTMDSRRLELPGMMGRVGRALASGIDMTAYEVSATRLRQVIRESPGNDALKRQLIAYLNRRVIKGRATAKCLLLGAAMAEFAETTDDEDLIAIHRNLVDLNKLPYVIANGRRVS
jgi:hypothetical protein